MKRICITYHLFKGYGHPAASPPFPMETAENCITTSFSDEIAEDLLKLQEDSRYIAAPGRETISVWLDLLAKLQGYDSGCFVLAEPAPETKFL